jgi:hypothetical protein
MLVLHVIGIFIASVLFWVFGNFVWYITTIFIASIPLLVFTVKVIKKKFVKFERLGKTMLWYALIIFALPWISWVYNLIYITANTKSPLHIVAIKNIDNINLPFVFVFSGIALAYLISSVGISKLKKWGVAFGILMAILALSLSAIFLLISLCGFIFLQGDKYKMMFSALTFGIGPLVLFLLLWPNALILYCLTRLLKPTENK